MLHGWNSSFFFLWEQMFFLMQNIFIVLAMQHGCRAKPLFALFVLISVQLSHFCTTSFFSSMTFYYACFKDDRPWHRCLAHREKWRNYESFHYNYENSRDSPFVLLIDLGRLLNPTGMTWRTDKNATLTLLLGGIKLFVL